MSRTGPFDVVVVGVGPAGCAVAITLAKEGCQVLLVSHDAPVRKHSLAETLSPAGTRVLRELGVWSAFSRDRHRPCHVNRYAWGSDCLSEYDFIADPRGCAWRLHRPDLERRMLTRAQELNVDVAIIQRSLRVARNANAWEISSESLSRSCDAKFVVDATGRPAWVARRQASRRVCLDRQMALVWNLGNPSSVDDDGSNLIESVPGGWWYSAVSAGGRLVAIFFTDCKFVRMYRGKNLQSLAGNATHTKNRVTETIDWPDAQPMIVDSGTYRLDPIYGDNWLAVGDAAMTYDPLASHGVTTALLSGRDAGRAILAYMTGRRSALEEYANVLNRAFGFYFEKRQRIYDLETRWPDFPYWRQRRSGSTPLNLQFRQCYPSGG